MAYLRPENSRCFYQANGWVEDGLPVGTFEMTGYPMARLLATQMP
jgi:hypothetical protein